MPRFQFQGTPLKPPAPTVALRSGSTTLASAGNKSFWLQYRSRAGFSLVSNRVDVTLAVGQGVDITIPLAALPDPNGVCIWEYVILASNSTNISEASVVASHPGYDSDQETVLPPPFVISLTQDIHFELSKVLAGVADLPVTNRLHGMRRYVDELSQIVEWDEVIDQWTSVYPQAFNTNVSDITGNLGANQDVAAIPDLGVVICPDYALDGLDSVAVGYWLVNDTSQPIPSGTDISVAVEIAGQDVSYTTGIVGGLVLTFQGYVNTTTGVLDTSGMTVGVELPYQGERSGLALPKPLPAGSAYYLTMHAALTPALLNNRILQGGTLSLSMHFYLDTAIWNASGGLFGDFIANEFGSRRVLPGNGLTLEVQAGSGNITLETGGSCSFNGIPAQSVFGLTANAANQAVWIGIDGLCIVAPTSPTGTRKRAIVSTVDGVGFPTDWHPTTVTLNGGKLLTLDVEYVNSIRGNYPDVIAATPAPINAHFLRVYVQPTTGGNILAFDQLILAEEPQSFLIGSTSGAVIGSTLPTPDSPSFGLFAMEQANITVGTLTGDSVFPAGTYHVCVALVYQNTVTAISHDPTLGCIAEAGGTFAELFTRSKYYGLPLTDLTTLAFDEITSYQTRLQTSNRARYYFDPTAFTGLKPYDLLESQPGRWVPEVTLETVVSENDVLTQILIFG